tara:strand:+ start:324 stop:518 length:195 start_codon:yes stop_codon:yes gene_type:complete
MTRKEFNEFRKEKRFYLKILKNQIQDMQDIIRHFKFDTGNVFHSSNINEIELIRTQSIFRKDKI